MSNEGNKVIRSSGEAIAFWIGVILTNIIWLIFD